MASILRTRENLNIDTSSNNVFTLIPAGRRIPASWEQFFTTSWENQRSFDIKLLRGNSDIPEENTIVGKWRVGGIPTGQKRQHHVNVAIRIGVDGSVSLSAALATKALPVTFLSEGHPEIPLTSAIPTIPLSKLIRQPCPMCLCNFVIETKNWKNQPFALCLDCGHEFELPKSQISNDDTSWDDLTPELLKTLGIEPMQNPGGLAPDEIQELQAKGFQINSEQDTNLRIRPSQIISQIPGMIFGQTKDKTDLEISDIIRLAGDPLPDEKRINCPKCDAVISRDAKRCEWCGVNL